MANAVVSSVAESFLWPRCAAGFLASLPIMLLAGWFGRKLRGKFKRETHIGLIVVIGVILTLAVFVMPGDMAFGIFWGLPFWRLVLYLFSKKGAPSA